MIDKAFLWEKLKSELEAESTHFYADFTVLDKENPVGFHGDERRAKESRAILDRMLQMETMS